MGRPGRAARTPRPGARLRARRRAGRAPAAPRLDGSRAWLDYERIAGKLTDPPSTRFTGRTATARWTGRATAASCCASRPASPSTARRPTSTASTGCAGAASAWCPRSATRRSRSTIRLAPAVARHGPEPALAGVHRGRDGARNRALASHDLQRAAGDVRDRPRQPAAAGRLLSGRRLRPAPHRPGDGRGGADYPTFASAYLTMDLPASVGGRVGPRTRPRRSRRCRCSSRASASTSRRSRSRPAGAAGTDATALLEASAYAPAYALAQRMKGRAGTPYRVRARGPAVPGDRVRLRGVGARPEGRAPPLVSFLFDEKVGFCQQFSGSMALLLRMGGIPTRIASGFTPGTYDSARREWVVRDYDAHSWVEAYFPGIGWVPFDPTPPAAPPAQPAGRRAHARGRDARPAQRTGRRRRATRRRSSEPGQGRGRPARRLVLAGVLVLLIALGAAVALVARLRRRPRRSSRPSSPSSTGPFAEPAAHRFRRSL